MPKIVMSAAGRPSGFGRLLGPGLALIATLVYASFGPDQRGLDPFFPLADAFLDGRLFLDGQLRTWLELVPVRDGQAIVPGQWYVPYPPLPAVLMMPLVLVFGVNAFDTNTVGAVVGGLGVWFVWSILTKLGLRTRDTLALTVAWAFGSEVAWINANQGTHLFAQTIGITFALVGVRLALAGQSRWAMVSIVLGGAARLPIALGLPAAFVTRAGFRTIPRADLVALAIVVIEIGIPLAAYNLARFGSPLDFGYARIQNPVSLALITDESWFRHGILSIAYVPVELFSMLIRGPQWSDTPPFLIPTLSGTGVLFTMPALAWVFRANPRDPRIRWLALAAALALVPDLLHGSWGFAQFGYRFIGDALPFLWPILGLVVIERGITRGLGAALLIGVAANLFGIWATATGWARY